MAYSCVKNVFDFSLINIILLELCIGFDDAGQQQIAMYEDVNFKGKLENLWLSIEPLYKQLHAYVRRKLVSHYGARRVRVDGPIPAHLLG